MNKKIIYVLIILSFVASLACSTATTSNSGTNKAVVVNTNSNNMPEGLTGNQIPLSANAPGISDPSLINANSNSKTSSTPGIPDTTKMGNTTMPTKTPRIQGIPDEETLRKQMTTPADRSLMDRKPPESDSNSQSRPPAKPRATHKQ